MRTIRLIVGVLLVLTLAGAGHAEEKWKADWSVPEGFAMQIDSEGFELPTSIAVVRNPGPGPKDPVYFVTELFGKLKVITRDRSIYTFAEDFFNVMPNIPPPSTWGEIGMAGITLDDEHGYVFASFLFHDAHGIMRNGMVRFQSKPGVFGLKAEGAVSYNKIFENESSWVNYQIGPMLVHDGALFVCLGDGGKPFTAQDLDYTTGKILRMSLDGAPLPDNPFYESNDPKRAKNYVWAYGFRNVFGIAFVGDRLLASENGIQIDRFMEIEKGQNYGWDGTDWSIGMNSTMVFGPTVGPVQLAWLPQDNPLFPPQYRSKLFLAMSFGQNLTTGVAMLDYDFEKKRLRTTPKQFVLLKPPPNGLDFSPTSVIQKVVGVAFGSDGLYMVVMYPVSEGDQAKSAVFRISYDPPHQHPYVLDKDGAAETLMSKHACWYCHSHDPMKKRAAPTLDDSLVPRLTAQLGTPEYRAQLKEMDAITPPDGFAGARATVLKAEGIDRVRQWIKYRLIDPKFDRKAAGMPAFNMSESDALTIATFLVQSHYEQAKPSWKDKLRNAVAERVGPPKYGHMAIAGAIGFASATVLFLAIGLVRRWIAARRTKA